MPGNIHACSVFTFSFANISSPMQVPISRRNSSSISQKRSFFKGCIINLGAIVDHGCILEEGVHICLGAIVKGENRIEKCSKIEAGEVVERGSRK